jgi:hypothetical protein
MAKVKSDQEKAEQKLARKAAAEERKEREARELRARRVDQFNVAERELARLDEAVRLARDKKIRHEALTSHLAGFYGEIDKLAKGRSLMEATPLIVEQVNDIIRDAKAIVEGDPYLDRVKEFVPAGNNPVYPDVLMVARSVQQCLGRTTKSLSDDERRTTKLRRDARTIVAALKYFIEHNEHPSSEDVAALLDAKPPDDWFFQGNDENSYFDFERLDRNGLGGTLTAMD